MGEASRPRHRPTPPPPRSAAPDREKLHVPDPDLTTVTLADAHLLGGPEGEPVHRESASIGAAWTLVDNARAALVGHAVPTASGGAWTVTPARCPAGHRHQPDRVLAG